MTVTVVVVVGGGGGGVVGGGGGTLSCFKLQHQQHTRPAAIGIPKNPNMIIMELNVTVVSQQCHPP